MLSFQAHEGLWAAFSVWKSLVVWPGLCSGHTEVGPVGVSDWTDQSHTSFRTPGLRTPTLSPAAPLLHLLIRLHSGSTTAQPPGNVFVSKLKGRCSGGLEFYYFIPVLKCLVFSRVSKSIQSSLFLHVCDLVCVFQPYEWSVCKVCLCLERQGSCFPVWFWPTLVVLWFISPFVIRLFVHSCLCIFLTQHSQLLLVAHMELRHKFSDSLYSRCLGLELRIYLIIGNSKKLFSRNNLIVSFCSIYLTYFMINTIIYHCDSLPFLFDLCILSSSCLYFCGWGLRVL